MAYPTHPGQHTHLDGQHGYICRPNCPDLERLNCQEPGECLFERGDPATPVEFYQDVPTPAPKIIRAIIPKLQPLPSRERGNTDLKLPPIKRG